MSSHVLCSLNGNVMDINPFNIKNSTKPVDIFIPHHVLIPYLLEPLQ